MLALSKLTIPYQQSFVDSDAESDVASEETLDDSQSPYLVGAPLTRMTKFEYMSVSSTPSSEDYDEEPTEYFVREEEINYIEEDISLFNLRLNGGDGEGPEGDPLLRTTSSAYVHSVVDHLAIHRPVSPSPQTALHATPVHPSHPLLVRHLPSTSTSTRELALWRYLNSSAVRRDPWNPSPPALSIIQRELDTSAADRLASIIESGISLEDSDEEAYVVMDRLWTLRDNPLKTTGDIVDFSRQMLQSLVFLHEHDITQVSLSLPGDKVADSIMMDIGLAPPQTHFSRLDFPVKYYLLDFVKAVRLRVDAPAAPRSLRQPHVVSGRGRPKNTVTLSASRPRGPSVLPKSYFGSLIVGVPSTYTTHGLSPADSEVTLVSSGPNTPPASIVDLDTPKQPTFSTRLGSPDSLSDPESDGSEDESSDEDEGNCVRAVSPATRTLLFAADLKNLANLLQEVIQPAISVSGALAGVLASMRQAKALSLSADDALRMFESAVSPFKVASVAS